MKTIVKVTSDDQQHNEFKKGESGYIDGYVNGGNGAPLCVVVIKNKIVLIPMSCLEAKGGLLKGE